jgi:hypothetical protein
MSRIRNTDLFLRLNQAVIPANELTDVWLSGLQVEARLGEKSPEERRMERLLRRTAREIYKLRKTRTNKGQLDVQSFRFVLYYLPIYSQYMPFSCVIWVLSAPFLDETVRIAGKIKINFSEAKVV